ncbi:MAG: tRNA uridine-5-carboxymethylaminomethyl(34) synthesis GTPase MnmE [Hyphomicrobiales bacterium]|nr:tRNA uridine-5-carboxymethylaminomethyl(34) synthesis GTPase MnmE [Hyphomicrobiales bacterium]MDE2373758.1 tRNA uridine-5-carboxymethylaminomethyl(34) synthesis GTPase MnmE [Hyphomicrobiales bacterium]
MRQTIFALSSGRPPAAIAVIRISGPQARLALERLIGRVPPPRQAALARVRDPSTGEVIDEALALWFPGPHSETGEDMAELQLHGGPAVIAAAFAALAAIPGFRPAEPGEFTRRAFGNGKLDLTEAEGLADLIAAETPAQLRAAFRQLKGQIGDRAEMWRSQIIEALALVEARIDFSDEADVPENLIAPAILTAQHLHDEMAAVLADNGRAERLRDGLVVAIAGPPNAGKSTLLNRLANREVAIVSPHPGTTRDVIEVHLNLGGYPVTLLDTAGIHEGHGPVEQEGIRRAKARAEAADLVLWVTDGSAIGRTVDDIAETLILSNAWRIYNKLDLVGDKLWISNELGSADSFILSALTGVGLDRLVAALSAYVADYFAATESSVITRARHRHALGETAAALDRAVRLGPSGREELIAEELRAAANTLGRLTGRIDVEDVLDVIFREFCIGK